MEAKTALEKKFEAAGLGKLLNKGDRRRARNAGRNVRSSLSIMKRLCLVKRVKGKRGVPYTITDAGKEHLARFGWDLR